MQNLYTNYDQIIENLIFFNDEVNLIQNINIFIEYVTLYNYIENFEIHKRKSIII